MVARVAELCRDIIRFIGAIVLVVSAGNAFGLDPGKHVSQYGHRAWLVQDGFFPGAPNAIAQTRDGYIWIGTFSGLVRFDGVKFVPFTVSAGEPLRSPVIVSLLGDLADGKTYPLSHEILLPPLTKDVLLEYTSPSFAAPQRVHFRYKLDGIDDKWVDSGNRRQALFSSLRPGVYRFRVSASADGVPWNGPESMITLRVPPKFYKTTWFMALCVASGLFAVLVLYKLRVDFIKRDLRPIASETGRA